MLSNGNMYQLVICTVRTDAIRSTIDMLGGSGLTTRFLENHLSTFRAPCICDSCRHALQKMYMVLCLSTNRFGAVKFTLTHPHQLIQGSFTTADAARRHQRATQTRAPCGRY